MKRNLSLLAVSIIFIWLFLVPQVLSAKAPVEVKLISEANAMVPGHPFWIGVHLSMDDGWHTYSEYPGDAGVPTQIEWMLPGEFRVSNIYWPMPIEFNSLGSKSFGYKGDVLLMAEIIPPAELPLGDVVTLKCKVDWLACKDLCVPGSAFLILDVPTDAFFSYNEDARKLFEETRESWSHEYREKEAKDGWVAGYVHSEPFSLFKMIVFAWLGGVLLNLMPCVFPVLGLKVMGFVEQAGRSATKVKMHSLVFSLGILVSFWILVVFLLGFRYAGFQLGWGFHLQSPVFVLFLTILFFILGLNFVGMFEWGMSWTGFGQKLTQQAGYRGSFFMGALVTLVATPCTGPFMGVALGFALASPLLYTFLIFTFLAIGLAFPYIVLSFFPKLLSKLPKPGPWMENVKGFLSFPLFASSIWLLYVLGHQIGLNAIIASLTGLLLITLGIWFCARSVSLTRKIYIRLIAVALMGMGVVIAYQGVSQHSQVLQQNIHTDSIWIPFDEKLIEEYRRQGRPVFVDFTASWCLTCQVNKATTLHTAAVNEGFKQFDVVPMIADWTNHDPVITQALSSFNRSGVPLYVLYPSSLDKEPILLPSMLTPDIVLDALKYVDSLN